jgi:hypothetical protein
MTLGTARQYARRFRSLRCYADVRVLAGSDRTKAVVFAVALCDTAYGAPRYVSTVEQAEEELERKRP